MLEIEVKIQIGDPGHTRKKLEAAGAALVKERAFEENTLYDFPLTPLKGKKQALRLRTTGKKHFLTFKGAPHKSRKFKIRDEFETEIKNSKHIQKILKSLGLQPVFVYKKFRTQFRARRLSICLDETGIGNFLELEGRQSDIVRFAEKLGISKKEFIKKDYIQLITEGKALGKL